MAGGSTLTVNRVKPDLRRVIHFVRFRARQTARIERSPAEGCQSGRLGQSRKLLYVQAYRGFESHPLRHPSKIHPWINGLETSDESR
jgi:hypothetical protein